MDPMTDYELEYGDLARRLKEADALRNAPWADEKQNIVQTRFGPFWIGNGPAGALNSGLSQVIGNLQRPAIQQEQRDLRQREMADTMAWAQGLPAASKDYASRSQHLVQGMQLPGLRQTLAAQLGQELDRPAKEEAESAKQVLQARIDAARDARQKQQLEEQMRMLEARIAGQIALRQMPTIHITNSGGGSGDPLAGAATQAGVDEKGMPVYRVSKTGRLFKYGENGAEPYEGPVMPKPAAEKAPSEAERTSAGYLGRMEAAEKAMANAPALPLALQLAVDKAPTGANYVLTPQQQVSRQQQEDWVRAKLRKESGAVIGEEEMAREIRTYFPRAGDSAAVINSKAQSRAQAIEQMRTGAGKVKPTEAAPVSAGRTLVTSKAEFDALPAGTQWETPDGKRGTK